MQVQYSRLFRLIQIIRYLDNWPMFILNYFRSKIGLLPRNSVLKLRNGLEFSVYENSAKLYPVFLEIFCWSVYDSHPYFKIGSRDVVIDIGANVGFFTLKAARSAIQGRVYAFEPFSLHFDLLNQNVQRNAMSNVATFKEAVWEDRRQIDFFYSLDVEPDKTSLFDMGGDRKETVETVTLEDVFRTHAIDVCDFLKMDCEGAEYNILFSTPDHILGQVRRIALEWHRLDEKHDPESLAHFLRAKGFTVIAPQEWTHSVGYIFAYRS